MSYVKELHFRFNCRGYNWCTNEWIHVSFCLNQCLCFVGVNDTDWILFWFFLVPVFKMADAPASSLDSPNFFYFIDILIF